MRQEAEMSHTLLDAAARLLVQIAGPEPVHIEMSARGPKKYYDVQRAITERDTRAHLLGRSTRGATLRHPGGMTRALCYDADTPDHWLRLVEAAWKLAEKLDAAYVAFLREYPPAGSALKRFADERGIKVSLKHRDCHHASMESVIADARELLDADRSARKAVSRTD